MAGNILSELAIQFEQVQAGLTTVEPERLWTPEPEHGVVRLRWRITRAPCLFRNCRRLPCQSGVRKRVDDAMAHWRTCAVLG